MRQALHFLTRAARTRTCALGPEQARQEALAIASIRSQIGIDGRASLSGGSEVGALVTDADRGAALGTRGDGGSGAVVELVLARVGDGSENA
jgi:glycerol-3-phosphate dehydrogenase